MRNSLESMARALRVDNHGDEAKNGSNQVTKKQKYYFCNPISHILNTK